jgi:hypothetical protein
MLDEAGWLRGAYLRDLLDHLCYQREVQRTKAGQRKLRLYGCACCRWIWHLIPEGPCRQAVETAERYAEGQATKQDLQAALGPAGPFLGVGPGPAQRDAVQAVFRVAKPDAKMAAWAGVDASSAFHGGWTKDDGVFCVLLRDLFGNPFQPIVLQRHWLTANGRAAVNLAHAIYDEQAFDRLPILADALQDAGCDNADVLDHCRGPGPHARGCWVVDLLRAKA